MARSQTMVQLTDVLVEELDTEATRRGISRSAVIREALEQYLAERRASHVGRRIADGYQRVPPATPDAWSSLAELADTGTGELAQRLDAEEARTGQNPW